MTHNNEATVSEKELLTTGYRKYSGEKMNIFYNTDKCQHVGNCVRGNPDVFEVGRRPWIITDNADNPTNESVINSCPTGALKFIKKEQKQMITYNEENNRFVAMNQKDEEIGETTWSNAGESMIIIDHTSIHQDYRGLGIGDQLIALTVSYARQHNKKVIPLCPFAKKEFDQKKEYQDVLK